MLPRQHPSTSALGPLKSPSSSDAGSGHTQNTEQICREYIRGNCTKYGQCKYRHELDTNRMKEILQFCHDYQNRNGCTRKNCKFLHASKEEQNTFLATGQIPRALAEKHAASAAAASNMQSNAANAETIPQIAMFISESYMSQPPPAPWPPLPPPQAVLAPVATAPPPPPPASSPPRHAAGPSVPSAQQLPPMSAPAPSVSQLRPVATTYSAMPQQTLFSINQPAIVVPEKFDPSKPPPPLPSHIQPTNNGSLKRKVDTNGNAATSKIRKPDGPEVSEQHCECCVQRELRIDGYKQQMEALHNEEETQILLYKKKLQEYEIGRDILKKLVGPELFAVFDNLIEGAQAPQLDNSVSFNSDSPTVSMQAVRHLFNMLLGGGTRNIIDPVPSTSHMDETLQSLTRRHNVGYNNAGPDLIKFVTDTLRSSNIAERSPSVEERPSEPTLNNRTNGYLANGQKPHTSTSEPTRYGAAAGYAGPSVQVPDFGARAHQAMPNYPVAGPSGYAGAPPPAPPPASYMYHPAVPPPNRHYYPQNPAVSGTGGMQYNGTERAPGPGPVQGMQPPAVPGALRPAANAPNYNYMARYPQPPYFPPYQ
ncbi:DNA translocase FtsK-like [Cydia pomonella]|uniref:Masculinizer transcript variant 4 n=1 Tax=Cydia pomonella TaxID=82600 RepID=A0AA49K488_CYDPO|nr:DNA translocase FtsK-like [Cydia pomonella]XP_061706365.1 DNA translocase FtsK-like [Cydia pomonella]XP_061706374.1 DNA translocase FtsK-like [Cydia pomonella]XP_061706381.1 DNA translocase FtsK-like [Cydia pomonella]WIF28762.1 masculinizer transcript variant 1 [Cydia pomonella]WIF28763.1 masculinizer transcript variant 2 [Cydia pomonella]WIF28764.1 masculinizer transcript variant 3 [Cydia pomonella]WIF28765.1 masculinizer transcript variant 4 [Cydia pomonella]WIF28766.1 masculinizer tra